MNRLSIKFVGGSLLMFSISAIYALYAIFRVLWWKPFIIIALFKKSSGETLVGGTYGSYTEFVSAFKFAILFFDAAVVTFFMVLLWYTLVRFLITPNVKYVRIFAIVFLIALFFYLIPSFLLPSNFCESYTHGVFCPSFCGLDFPGAGIPEAYPVCVGRGLYPL